MAIDLIATDLDGTFLDSKGRVSELNRRAVLLAAQQGVTTVIATGRPPRWLDGVLDTLRPARPTVIASNGALVVDLDTRRIEQIRPVPADAALEYASRLQRVVPDAHFAVEYSDGWGREPAFTPRQDRGTVDAVDTLADLLVTGQPVKLLASSASLSTQQLAEAGEPLAAGLLTCTYSYVSPQGLLELSAPGISKGSALAGVLAELGLSAAGVAAFGDMPNDLDMLQMAGQPYVMANAHPALLAAGFPVAGDHNDSGVGAVVLRLLAESANGLSLAG